MLNILTYSSHAKSNSQHSPHLCWFNVWAALTLLHTHSGAAHIVTFKPLNRLNHQPDDPNFWLVMGAV